MTDRLSTAVYRAGNWTAVHTRRHLPFVLYAAATLSSMAWVSWTIARAA